MDTILLDIDVIPKTSYSYSERNSYYWGCYKVQMNTFIKGKKWLGIKILDEKIAIYKKRNDVSLTVFWTLLELQFTPDLTNSWSELIVHRTCFILKMSSFLFRERHVHWTLISLLLFGLYYLDVGKYSVGMCAWPGFYRLSDDTWRTTFIRRYLEESLYFQ